MRTTGEILKKARLEKKLSLEDVEKSIRIRKKFLEALEQNDWEKLPSLPYIKGFLRNYSTYLGLVPDEMIAVFRRQFKNQEDEKVLPDSATNPVHDPAFRLSPQSIIIGIVVLFLTTFFGYLFLQYRSYTSAPMLTINQPQEGQTYTTDTAKVTGKTDSDAVINVNKQNITISDTGDFDTTVKLNPGTNTIVIESTSKYGKKNSVTRTVQLQDPK
jgi:cytoskeletal protein RodZ